MFTRLGILSIVLWAATLAQAQQLPLVAQYRYAQGMLNPAAVSSDFFLYEYNINVVAGSRLQWFNQPETPRTVFASGEYISDFGGAFELIAGGNLLQDQTGPISLSGVYGRLGSIFTRDPYLGGFGVGFNLGMAQYQIDADRIVWKDPTDPAIPLNDIQLRRPDLGVGLFYYKRIRKRGFFDEDNIYLGLSVPQLLSSPEVIVSAVQEVAFRRVPHMYGTLGWYHFFNEDVFLELSTWTKYVKGAPLNVDLNARLQPGRTLWVGLGGNINGMMHLEAGINLPGLLGKDTNCKIGYGFDYNLTAFNLPFGSAHELVISMQFDSY